MAASTKVCEPTAIQRRSGNYKPCSWGLDYLLSLKSNFTSKFYTQRAEGLKGDVKIMLGNVVEPLSQFELIDDLQRLGLSYHFVEEIKDMLNNIYSKISNIHEWTKSDLHATALAFRLLRQHNYHIHEEIFKNFKDEKGNFKISLCDDVKGMLSLYEASYLSTEGEIIMEEAYQFTSKRLKDLKGNVVELYLGMLVSHALEVPLHWNVLRAEARWFIDVYEKRSDMNPTLLELAKLDFNIVQGLYQEELRDVARWWKNIGLQEKISFSRDSLINAFFWTMGTIFEPKFGYCRTTLAKSNQLMTVVDDMYDVYGTVDELELFTDAIERWDSISAMEQLPDYMKICYLAVYHNVHEWAYDILREHGFDALSSIKKTIY